MQYIAVYTMGVSRPATSAPDPRSGLLPGRLRPGSGVASRAMRLVLLGLALSLLPAPAASCGVRAGSAPDHRIGRPNVRVAGLRTRRRAVRGRNESPGHPLPPRRRATGFRRRAADRDRTACGTSGTVRFPRAGGDAPVAAGRLVGDSRDRTDGRSPRSMRRLPSSAAIPSGPTSPDSRWAATGRGPSPIATRSASRPWFRSAAG